jgi:hypothetical protein
MASTVDEANDQIPSSSNQLNNDSNNFFNELAEVEVPTKVEPMTTNVQRSSRRKPARRRRLSSGDSELSGSLDEDYETKFSEYLKKKPHNKWTEKETLYLVYLVEMYGKNVSINMHTH